MTVAAPVDLSTQPALLRRRLGPAGVWFAAINGERASKVREAASEIEQLGYGAFWGGEGPLSRDVFAASALILEATSSLVVTSAVANIYARDAHAAKSGALTLGDGFPGRFCLGIGVSHAPLVRSRGHDYAKPVAAMRDYVDAIRDADYLPPAPEQPVPLVLAALGPKMLALAGERSAGTHTYFVPVSHTAAAREQLGPDPYIAVELMVLLSDDPIGAARTARRAMRPYLEYFPNYVNNLRRLGYDDVDFRDGGSDRLVADLVASGCTGDIIDRVAEHLDAGADHVCVQPLARVDPGLAQLRELAPALQAL
jgi:probable F420-dependent oxidoreductase